MLHIRMKTVGMNRSCLRKSFIKLDLCDMAGFEFSTRHFRVVVVYIFQYYSSGPLVSIVRLLQHRNGNEHLHTVRFIRIHSTESGRCRTHTTPSIVAVHTIATGDGRSEPPQLQSHNIKYTHHTYTSVAHTEENP